MLALIADLLDRKPKQLSGGQRQRVAMGRAIVRDPKVFLFDEPLSNLDAKLRVQMRTEIKKVHQKVRTTTVYVTHDQVEAMTPGRSRRGDECHGCIEQVGAPERSLSFKPATKFVAGFIGSPAMNFIPCNGSSRPLGQAAGLGIERQALLPGAVRSHGRPLFRAMPRKSTGWCSGCDPEHITETRKAHVRSRVTRHDFDMPGSTSTEPMGMETLIYFTLEGAQVCGRVNPNAGARDGAPLRLAVDLNNMHLLNEVTGVVL